MPYLLFLLAAINDLSIGVTYNSIDLIDFNGAEVSKGHFESEKSLF